MTLKNAFVLAICCCLNVFAISDKTSQIKTIQGHLKAFGNHRKPTVRIEMTTSMPTPQDFHRKFVVPETPVVFIGAARHSPAYWFWTKEYLVEKYGDLIVRLENQYEGEGRMPSSEFGYGRDSIKNVLMHSDGSGYIISQVPAPMEVDIAIPPCLGCGSLEDGLQEVHLFITGKGGKTLIHRDPYSNIHCLFNGTKDWLLIHKNQTRNIYQSASSRHEFGGFSNVDVDSVNLIKYPKVVKVEFGKVTLNKGDCIYVPAGYWHQVRVNGDYNTAVSIWFTRNFKFLEHDWSKCPQKWEEPLDYKQMNQMDILWRFSGQNEELTQGHMDVHVLRALLLSYARNKSEIKLETFCQNFIKNNKTKKNFMESLRADKNGFVKKSYIEKLSKHNMKQSLEIIDPSDPSNSKWFEYSEISKDSILHILLRLSADGVLLKSEFVEQYRKLGGTSAVGQEIFKGFAGSEKSLSIQISKKDLKAKANEVLQKFFEARSHDPTMERKWHKHLQDHDEL